MSAEQNLERAGADLRAASGSMPFPLMRVRQPIRQGITAFATGLVVALIIGVPFYMTRTSPPDGAPVGAPADTTTTEAPDTTTTSVPTTSPTRPVPPACGSQLPYQVTLPEDFTGPIEGPSPHTPDPAEEGQLIVHWLGRDGSVEIRWPANEKYLENAVWGKPDHDSPRSPDSPMFIGPPVQDVDGVEHPFVTEVLPTEAMSGPCDGGQLAIYRPRDDEDSELARATFGTGSQDGLIIYPGLARPRDKVLVVETIETDTIPKIRACDGGPEGEFVPKKTATTPDNSTFDTPEEALQDLLGTDVARTWPKVGYFKLVSSDGTITFGNPYDDNSPDPRPDNGLLISVTVVAVEDGWTVTEWETSGC